MNPIKILVLTLACVCAMTPDALAARGRPTLNSARTTFVADNGRLMRGPAAGTEYGGHLPLSDLLYFKSKGCNALHLYAENFVSGYAAGTRASDVDAVVAMTRTNGMYLIITIANSWANGSNSLSFATNFWNFYAPRYKDETHVIYEIHNEPVAWGPPYSSSSANPPGAMNMETACYKIIRAKAPNTPVLLFTYSVLGGSGGASAALTDIQAFNTAIWGTASKTWTNEAVAFHGYAGAESSATAAAQLIANGYPCFQTEFAGRVWDQGSGTLDDYGVFHWERLKISWLHFGFDINGGMSDPSFKNVVDLSGLSWTPDSGTWPAGVRSPYGNNGYWRRTPGYTNSALGGTLRIQAEDFDNGGKNIAYYNANSSNPGGQYRTDHTVGIETTSDTDGGYNVGWIAANDWLEYSIDVPVAGLFNLRLRVAGTSAGKVNVLADGKNLTGDWTLPNTGGWQTWTTTSRQVLLGAGLQKLRINVATAGFNLNWIELSPVTTGPVADGTYKFVNSSNSLALDVDSSSQVITATSSSSSYQQWTLTHIGGGQYKVASLGNGYYWSLYSSPLHLASTWGSQDYRCFIIAPVSSDKFRLITAGSGYSFEPTTNSAHTLGAKPWNGSTAQQWSLLNRVTNGTYRIVARHSGKAVNASGSTNKTQIVQMTYSGAANQKWTVTDTGSGNYKLVGVQSGRALDIAGSGTANGTKVQLYDSWNTAGQLFKFVSSGSTYFRIVPNCATGSGLDVSGQSTADGAVVDLWQWNGGNNQQWTTQAP